MMTRRNGAGARRVSGSIPVGIDPVAQRRDRPVSPRPAGVCPEGALGRRRHGVDTDGYRPRATTTRSSPSGQILMPRTSETGHQVRLSVFPCTVAANCVASSGMRTEEENGPVRPGEQTGRARQHADRPVIDRSREDRPGIGRRGNAAPRNDAFGPLAVADRRMVAPMPAKFQ